mgnify:CR=1 FL=1
MVSDDEDSLIKKVGPLPSLPLMEAATVSGLPAGEPLDSISLKDKRGELVARIQELSDILKYMGDGHPKRAQIAEQLANMKKVLQQMTDAMGGE